LKNRKINILHLLLSLKVGGLENVVYNLVGNLDRTIFNVSVCCIDEFGELEHNLRDLNIYLALLKRKEQGIDWLLSLKLARLLKEKHIDIIHTHNFSPNFYGSIAGRLSGVSKIITTQHNKRFFEEFNKKRLLVFRTLYYLNHKIVFVSKDAKDLAIKTINIPSRKVTVIHNGIDVNRFRPKVKDKALLNEFRIKDEFIIGTVGRLSKEKNIVTVLKAFKQVLKKKNNIKLLIVGDGSEKATLVKESSRLNIDSQVIFAGYREDIPDLLNIMDIFVMPSLTEGISLTLLEAMATEKPVIVTKVGGNVEIIDDGYSGIFVKPGDIEGIVDKLNDLFSDPLKKRQIAFNARQKVLKDFSLESMVNKYTSLYLS